MQLALVARSSAETPTEGAARAALAAEGFEPFAWTDPPGAHYTPHAHDHDESIVCVAGEITFGAGGRALRLEPGDRLMLPAGTVHTADVGPAGATYVIGQRRA